ncbi:MAG: DNA polymerase III subunit epsilon [Succinivibrionaceae bacterium]|nr:DNA polymerase III subunit epsilon [Succinivibrionaceae bacterium]
MAQARQIALDTETTGKEQNGTPGEHRVNEIGCVEIVDRNFTGRELQIYLDPEREVDYEATKVHGFTWEMLKGKPRFRDIAAEFVDFIRGSELLIHNAAFDTRFLDHEFMLMGSELRLGSLCKITDTLGMARRLHPGKMVSLDHLCNRYKVDRSRRTLHGALLDAQLLGEVYLAMTGGQRSLEFTAAAQVVRAAPTARWSRPQGLRLPSMAVDQLSHARHVDTLISLAQTHEIRKGEDGSSIAGSAWGDEYDMQRIVLNEGDDKKEFKRRLAKQHEQKAHDILGAELFQGMQRANRQEYDEWVQRLNEGRKIRAGKPMVDDGQ